MGWKSWKGTLLLSPLPSEKGAPLAQCSPQYLYHICSRLSSQKKGEIVSRTGSMPLEKFLNITPTRDTYNIMVGKIVGWYRVSLSRPYHPKAGQSLHYPTRYIPDPPQGTLFIFGLWRASTFPPFFLLQHWKSSESF